MTWTVRIPSGSVIVQRISGAPLALVVGAHDRDVSTTGMPAMTRPAGSWPTVMLATTVLTAVSMTTTLSVLRLVT